MERENKNPIHNGTNNDILYGKVKDRSTIHSYASHKQASHIRCCCDYVCLQYSHTIYCFCVVVVLFRSLNPLVRCFFIIVLLTLSFMIMPYLWPNAFPTFFSLSNPIRTNATVHRITKIPYRILIPV